MTRSRSIQLAVMVLVGGGWGAAALADGATYYVRQGGSDLSDGATPDTALRSIQHAVARCAGAGNSIIVGPGVYYEQVFVGSGAGSAAGSGAADSPNLILADTTGSETGDRAAAVVIDGDGVRECGILLSHRGNWTIVGMSFRGQSRRAVSIERCDGIEIDSCTIEAPRRAGIEANDCDRLHIAGNTFVRRRDSGSCIVVRATSRTRDDRGAKQKKHDHDDEDDHGRGHAWGRSKHDVATSGATGVIEGNRFSMIGASYLGSDFARGGHGRHDHTDGETYGIRVEISGERGSAEIINNVGSDCWGGISLQLDGEDTSGVIANNSLVGCRVGIEVEADHGAILLADNIVAHSKFAISVKGRESRLVVSGLLTFEIGASVMLGKGGSKFIPGHVQNVNPQWVAPSAGNFALEATSPAVDAGLGAARVGRDLHGLERPWDGNGDGEAIADLGAVEYHPEEGQNHQLRLVRWREIEP